PTKAGQGQNGCVSIFRKSTIGFLMFLILSHTSICLPIYQVVHGKHHRIERTKRCATGSGRTASLPCLALSLSPAQPPGPTKQDRGRAGVHLFFIYLFIFIFLKSTNGFLMFLIVP